MNLSLFIATFFLVSITPGLCMTLAMTLGMRLGIKRTVWMMVGELVGVALIAGLAVIGIAALLINYPTLFNLCKYLGGGYLLYIAWQLWHNQGSLAFQADTTLTQSPSRWKLISQGFITATSNPKGWAFFIALLPPFLSEHSAIGHQLAVLLSLIVLIEFICLMIYASGGAALGRLLIKRNRTHLLNQLAGALMCAVAIWLMIS